MNNLHLSRTGFVVAGLSIAFFALCMFWGAVLSSAELKDLHIALMKIAYPGFAMTASGILIGLVESFVYGFIFGALFAWLCKIARVSRSAA